MLNGGSGNGNGNGNGSGRNFPVLAFFFYFILKILLKVKRSVRVFKIFLFHILGEIKFYFFWGDIY